MSMIKIDWNPSVRKLRQFGFCALVALPLAAWMLTGWSRPDLWTGADVRLLAMGIGVGVVAAALALAWPVGLKPVFLATHVLTIPIGIVVGEVLLGAVYLLVFTPVALLFRMIGRDALERRLEPAASSYWLPRTQPADSLQYFRQS